MYQRPKAAFIFVLCCLVLTACRLTPQSRIVTPESTPWVNGQEQVIAFADFSAAGLSLPEGFLAQMEADLRLFFLEQGYRNVISSDVYNSLLAAETKAINGYFDVNSGRINSEKHEQVLDAVFGTMLAEHKADIILYLKFVKTAAPYRDKIARWDNVEDHTVHPPTILWTMNSGTMPAVSVQIIAVNFTNKQQYKRVQGLQVIHQQPNAPDIFLDDIYLHKSNLRKGLQQLSLKPSQ